MKKLILAGLCVLFLLHLSWPVHAGDLLHKADSLFKQGGLDNWKQAIELYATILESTPAHFEANWKCARAYRQYGEHAKRQRMDGWKEICAEYGKQGMKYALKAIDLEPERVESHYYYGLCVGIYSDGVSILTALAEGLKNKTQSSFEKAYDINKMFDEAGPILALGRFWAVVPWPFQNKKKALKFYREFQTSPYFIKSAQAKVYLAELLLKMNGDKARKEAEALLKEAVKSREPYFRDWAKRLLLQNE